VRDGILPRVTAQRSALLHDRKDKENLDDILSRLSISENMLGI
jgi:hypothetical protein